MEFTNSYNNLAVPSDLQSDGPEYKHLQCETREYRHTKQ